MGKTRFIILTLILSGQLLAMPKNFEIWFLSIDKKAALLELLNKEGKKISGSLAQAIQCQPMGEYCFDPQVGLYKPGENQKVEEEVIYEALDSTVKQEQPATASSVDRQMINCDGDSYFDIFCGKANEEKKSDVKLEIWIDISSTLRQVDFVSHTEPCMREIFLQTLDKSCPFNKKMRVSIFNESRKEAGTMNSVCTNYGLNNMDRIIQEVKESSAKNLIIITDIFEAQEKLIDFVESYPQGKIKGVDTPLYPSDLKKLAVNSAALCQ